MQLDGGRNQKVALARLMDDSKLDSASAIREMPEVSLCAYLRALRKWEQPSHSLALVNGLPLARMSILSAIYDVKRERSDIGTVRLSQDILEHGDEFPFHLMRNLAQELTSREGLSPELDSLATEYLRPFEISEKTRKAGFSLRFFVSREDKLLRREKYAEEVRRVVPPGEVQLPGLGLS